MGIKVILYEDLVHLRTSLASLIGGADGFELVASFENCNNVVRDIRSYQPDVVLMDIDMPGVNGIEGTKLIRQNFLSVEVLMLTVFDDDEKVFAAICAGASGYLLKKSSNEKILEAIQDVYHGGSPMTSSIARKVLRYFPAQTARADELNKLTQQEMNVLQLLSKGNSYKMVATELNISIDTVRTYIRRMYEKLQVHSVTGAIGKLNILHK